MSPSDPLEAGEVWYLPDPLGFGEVLFRVHLRAACSGTCAFHNPSDHWAVEMPLSFSNEERTLLRVCEHGAGHPDPDAWDWRARTGRAPEPDHHCDCEMHCRGFMPPF